jgi:hypothetical protein
MTALVPYQSQFMIPQDAASVSLVYVIQPNELHYEGMLAIALTPNALWLCTSDRNHDIIHLQSVRDTEVKDFRGYTFNSYIGGKLVYVNPRDAWGVVIKHQGIGEFRYSLSFLTFFQAGAIQWQNKIQQAIASYDKNLYLGGNTPD